MYQGLHMSSFFGPPFAIINKYCHTKWQPLDVNYCSNVSASKMQLLRFLPFPVSCHTIDLVKFKNSFTKIF